MPYTITTKDGITINNIPDDVAPDSQSLKDRVDAIRAGKTAPQKPLEMQAAHPAPSAMVAAHEPTVQAPAQEPEWIKPEGYPFAVRRTVTPDTGIPTYQREDGAIWYGPEQGNTGKADWFQSSGLRAGRSLETTGAGVTGAVVRGAGPYAAGAATGGSIAGPPGAAVGTGAVGLAKLVGDPVTNIANELGIFPTKQWTTSEAFQHGMDWLGITPATTPAERIVQGTSEAVGGAMGGIGLGQTMARSASPTVSGIGSQLASNPLQQIAGAAGSGAAAQTAAESGAGPLVQLGAGLIGGVGGAMAAQPRSLVQRSMALPDIGQAEQVGVRVMTSDALPPRTFASRWLQGLGEKIPVVGTGGMRQAQQGERIQAIRDVLLEFGADDVARASDDVMKDLASKRASDVTKYTGLKRGVIDKLSGSGAVPVDATTQAIDDQINKLKALNTQEVAPVIARLEDWKGAIQGQSIDNIEMLRAQIGESFKAPDMASSRSIGEKALTSIYKPLRDEMGEFIKANGNRTDYTKWRVANARLSESMGELKNDALRSVLKKGEETPEVVQKMLFSQKPSDVKALMSNLSVDGKNSAKMAILAKAAKDAGGVENLSPEKFISAVNKLGTPIGVAFTGSDAQRLNGLIRVLKLTSQASKSALVPSTGVQAIPIVGTALLTDVLGGSGAALASTASIGALARLYESAPVRNILMAIPKVKVGSPEEAALFKRFMTASQQVQEKEEKR